MIAANPAPFAGACAGARCRRVPGGDPILARRAAEGFTLVELLIALVIMALAGGVMFGSLRLAARSWEAGEAKLEDSASARLAQQFLRTHLQQHYPLRMRKEPGQPLWFEGDRESLRFAGFLPDRVNVGGIFLLRLAVARNGQRDDLVLHRSIPDGPVTRETSFDGAETSVLAADVSAVRIGYFGRDSDEGEPRWVDTWSDPQRLPILLRIEVQPRRGAPWPPLIVEPKLAVEAGCAAWNPTVRQCVG